MPQRTVWQPWKRRAVWGLWFCGWFGCLILLVYLCWGRLGRTSGCWTGWWTLDWIFMSSSGVMMGPKTHNPTTRNHSQLGILAGTVDYTLFVAALIPMDVCATPVGWGCSCRGRHVVSRIPSPWRYSANSVASGITVCILNIMYLDFIAGKR